MQTLDLFSDNEAILSLGAQAFVLRDFAAGNTTDLLTAIDAIEKCAPFRHMVTPGGFTMSVAMTNSGRWGWVSDRRGYRYAEIDPDSGLAWPAMPVPFARLAKKAAAAAGFPGFTPDACLINRYRPGDALSLHQDRNERDLDAPIVSVSLGMRATFLFGGHERRGRPARVAVQHGDVVVWGGEDRLRFHGVSPLQDEPHAVLGAVRLNLTFRKAS